MPRKTPTRALGPTPEQRQETQKLYSPPKRLLQSKADTDKETKHEKFVRLANFRTKRIIKDIRSLARLGSDIYERSPDEIDKLEDAISRELESAFILLRRRTREDASDDII